MRIFLRQIRLSASELEKAVANLPPEKQMSPEQMREALTALVERGWLKEANENGQAVYSVNQIR